MFVGASPWYRNEWTIKTPYGIMEEIIETGFTWILEALGTADDSIINTFLPVFTLNQLPWENATETLYRLIQMTKCYLRPKPSKTFKVVYPQTADVADHTYYSYQAHYFKEYTEKKNELVPNRIVVFANFDPLVESTWAGKLTGDTGAYSGQYVEVIENFIASSITNQTDVDNRAAAILTRIRSESLSAYLVVPHDASVELYDKVSIDDARGF